MNGPKPIVISCGEPAGVGPEIVEKAWDALRSDVPMLWLGDPRHLAGQVPHRIIGHPSEAARTCPEALPVMRVPFAAPTQPGLPDPHNAQGVINVIAQGVQMVMAGDAAALCTAPINKKALKDGAGFAYPGHTEYLAALAGVKRVVMMLACPQLRVVPATIHIPLKDVPAAFTSHLLRETIEITAASLRTLSGFTHPRIAIAGLNPHAGEGGAMGTEETDWMIPLITAMREEGYDLRGPMPPDTMFHAAARATYDVAICAYHDQALIPIKTIDFAGGVNVTLGLPFVRTSPDHGTAFDIAGRGIADPSSMIAALRMAQDMSLSAQTTKGGLHVHD